MYKKHGIEKDKFYQSKYNYFENLCKWIVITCTIISTTYWISDCQIFGRTAIETIFPRLFMLIPLILYTYICKHINNYKIAVTISYMMLHGIMWCAIWSIYYLPTKHHANEGFVIMHLMFMAMGICAPIKYSVLFHSLTIINIIISYPINNYDRIDLILSLGIPVIIGVEAILYFVEKSYLDQYIVKLELVNMSTVDQLTKAYNRNKLVQLCHKETDKFLIDEACILLMDVDWFKNVNDTYGHHEGDKILIRVVNIIKQYTSDEDYIIRWGGEEFAVILFNKNMDKAEEIAKNIRKAIEECKDEICKFTVSIGIAEYDKVNYHEAMKDADEALYNAKRQGRNRVIKYTMEGDKTKNGYCE